ncbi:sll7028 (plasmid) [Synechocystis sp. PCC 6803]|uniref:Sll7028 protein n=1 Tax=Synechocystis sp. (strain ATCC 27184 / PCC 6803 / Kazusa) TaxID=1111708 RepID=Q6ZEH0_SYNY3|nr:MULTISPECIES: VWA-like domain-containing protein [unclassified Synechocystis]AGF53582.1 hypothetical protein MYO_4260 [Synechocystis sp. PCC 6803]AVP91434.1 hypothetical protein C7I86_16815 [Synechocystis sp. IPPAS B-1465]MBD2618938.1 hypothetical protein [Synechocystis sp. FACHB-898]MBD2637429.1 hypothetical protein [Synechocystis sp. FACHB-908]MBD2661552.1 hypothetical protein [Synechocystis sp. FACHB-929]
MSDDCQALLSATRLRLRMQSPFFATLALFARYYVTEAIPTAGTEGKNIYFNPHYLAQLTPAERDGLFLHELLHGALLHQSRRASRLPELWNIAADIVVNGMIVAEGKFVIPKGGLREPELEKYSVEEVYELLIKRESPPALPIADLLQEIPNLTTQSDSNNNDNDLNSNDSEPNGGQSSANSSKIHSHSQDDQEIHRNRLESPRHQEEQLAVHWRNAIQQATVVARSQFQGNLPEGLERHLGEIGQPQLDWRTYLWRFLVHTPNDFQGYDRRFIHQGLYLEALVGESVEVFCCIDTSGSVGDEEMGIFLSELRGIFGSYPQIKCWLWYADADCYGPYELDNLNAVPKPQGGGGTDFRPFFTAVDEKWSREKQAVICYLTDGYGSFPDQAPPLDTLWVVSPGGKNSDGFPFGEVVRLRS